MKTLLSVVLGASLALAGCQTTPAASTSKRESQVQRSLPTPQYLPETARILVRRKMQAHGDDMTVLLWAMLFLDFQSAGEIAEAMAAEPRFARPTGADPTELNAQLPASFFEMQDELGKRAKALVDLSGAVVAEPDAFAKAYGELAQTCIRCHTAYLHEPPPTGANP